MERSREKKKQIFIILLSVLFSVFWVLGNYNQIVNSGVNSMIVGATRMFLFCLFFYIIIKWAWDKILNYEIVGAVSERKKSKRVYWGIFGVCIVCWLPYFLTLYPGVITWDSEWQVEQALGLRGYSNHQPWIQTLVIKFCCFIGGIISDDVNAGVAIYVILQMCILAGIYSYFIYYLYQKGTRKLYLAGCLIFYAIFPINAFYAVTMWKDVIMGAIVLMFSLVLWKMQRNDQTKMDFVLFFVLGVLISLLRSNGFYAYLLCIPFLIL